jgi:glycerophosphoryl diester phosphodiesterase
MGPVITIAHGAGNRRVSLEEALEAGVEAVEADLRLDGDRLVARHERRLPFLPIFFDEWYVRWRSEPQVTLDEVLERLKSRASLLADIKSTSLRSVKLLLAALRSHDAVAETRVSTSYWNLLRWLHEAEPQLRLYHSIGEQEELERFRQLLDNDPTARAVSIRQTLVDEEAAERFRARGIEVAAYQVDELSRAQELISRGVSGIISDNLEMLQTLKGGESSPTKPPG